MGDPDTTMAELERRGLGTESRLGIAPRPCTAFRAPGGSGSPSTSSPAPGPMPASAAGTTSAPGRAEATGSPARQRRLPPRAISLRARVLARTRATDRVRQRRGAMGQLVLAEMVGHDNHWKISVVQSPPWRRT
jgi:hypothetical protein